MAKPAINPEREEIRRIAESLGGEASAPDATTYAPGQLAKRYYAGGRVMAMVRGG